MMPHYSMGGGKTPKEIRERRIKGKPKRKTAEAAHTSILRRGWNLFVSFTAIVTVVGAFFYFRPTVEIETPSYGPSDPHELFSRPFVIKNNSPFFSVFDVQAACGIVRVLYDPTGQDVHGLATQLDPPISEFEAGKEHSLPCRNPIQSARPMLGADVVLSLDYRRPWLFLGHTITYQGYRARIGSDGKAYWTPYASSVKPPPMPPA
jgi:hypothetical protein